MNTLMEIGIGAGGGAFGGWVAGFILNYLTWWGKDLRDNRLRARGLPLPKDRVFPHYQWIFAVFGAITGALLSLAGVKLLWVVLANITIPIFFLPFLLISTIMTIVSTRPLAPQKTFDPEILVGKDVATATKIIREYGWYAVVDDLPGDDSDRRQPRPANVQYPSLVEIKVRDGRVTKATLGG